MADKYVKYKCKKCGHVEYYNLYGARANPNPFVKGCKKSHDGYHVWDKGVNVSELPVSRRK